MSAGSTGSSRDAGDPAGATPHRARLLVIGGFLGAGKTTALLRLAQDFHDEGLRVGLITNDQAPNLVDTGSVRVRGFRVEEVAGACFCCKFDELAERAERLRAEDRPHVLLAEPVGSCTDLAATVIAPFGRLHSDRFDVAPYSVLVDPVRARQMVIERGFGGFSSKVAYIFWKQLEEADIICLNKADLLAPAERQRLLDALSREFPRARVLPTSGLTGAGYAEWRVLLDAGGPAGRHIVDVDYDLYAEGEAELGWLNMALTLRAAAPFDGNALLTRLAERMLAAIAARGAEVAHLKLLLEPVTGDAKHAWTVDAAPAATGAAGPTGANGAAAVINCVGAGSTPHLSQKLAEPVREASLIVNARVHLDPLLLRELADSALASVLHEPGLREAGVRAALGEALQFRPGRPVPTHRDAVASGYGSMAARSSRKATHWRRSGPA